MPIETKELKLIASIDVESTPADLQPWDAQDKILKNTGIERDGGITNLYNIVEQNTIYAETLFTKNNKRVRLIRDDINGTFRVVTNEKDIGQIPQWGVADRKTVSAEANDVMATIDDTLLLLKISASLATVEEITSDTLEFIRSTSFSIPSNISDGFFVRRKAPTYANTTSIIGVFAVGNVLNHTILVNTGAQYTAAGQLGFVNSSQVFGYYENGWIVSSTDENDVRTFLFNSAGTQQGTFTQATYLVANHDTALDTVTFTGWRNVVALGTPGTYGNTFTPPAAPLGVWTITPITATITNENTVKMTFGGYSLSYGVATKVYLYHNNKTVRTWTTGHYAMPEIYGYLDNKAEIAFKTHTILYEGSYLSASFDPDGVGNPITEVGELNAYYYPQIIKCTDGGYLVIYRRGDGSYALIHMKKDDSFDRLQEIAPGVVKINTTSGICVADANDNDLQFGGNAYNGFIVVGFDAVAPLAQRAYVCRYRGVFGGSVDTNYKSTAAVTVGSVNLLVMPESITFSPNNETFDIYVGTLPASITYYRSLRDGIAQSIKSSLQGTLYIDDQVIPPPIGVLYEEQTIKLIASTAVREIDYDGYQLFNETPGLYESFRLYGNLYLFDGEWIHLTQLSTNVLQRIDHIANALGLTFIAESPNAIYFHSMFDNSLYTFDGGQSVIKQIRFNQRTEILKSVYSTYENTLVLGLIGSLIFIRDGIISEVQLPFEYPYKMYTTTAGVWIVKESYAIRYLYNPVSGSGIIVIALDLDGGTWGTIYTDTYDGGTWGTAYADLIDSAVWGDGSSAIVRLEWRSKYNGFMDRLRQNIDRYMMRVYKQDKEQATIVVDYYSYDENSQYHESKNIVIGDSNNPYDDDGYCMIEYIPTNKNGIASSIQFACDLKIVFMDAFAGVSATGESVVINRG